MCSYRLRPETVRIKAQSVLKRLAKLLAVDATSASFNLCKLRAVGRPLNLDAFCRPHPTPTLTTRRRG